MDPEQHVRPEGHLRVPKKQDLAVPEARERQPREIDVRTSTREATANGRWNASCARHTRATSSFLPRCCSDRCDMLESPQAEPGGSDRWLSPRLQLAPQAGRPGLNLKWITRCIEGYNALQAAAMAGELEAVELLLQALGPLGISGHVAGGRRSSCEAVHAGWTGSQRWRDGPGACRPAAWPSLLVFSSFEARLG